MKATHTSIVLFLLTIILSDFVSPDRTGDGELILNRQHRRHLRQLRQQRKRNRRPSDVTSVLNYTDVAETTPTAAHFQPSLHVQESNQRFQQPSAITHNATIPTSHVDRMRTRYTDPVSSLTGRAYADMRKGRIRAMNRRLFEIQMEITERLRPIQHAYPPPQQPHNAGVAMDTVDAAWLIPRQLDGRHGIEDFTINVLHASCLKPSRADDSWFEPIDHLRMFFDIPRRSVYNNDVSTIISTVVLKMYKKRIIDWPRPILLDESGEETDMQDDTVTVTIYKYLKPSRRNKQNKSERMTIIDAKAVKKSYEGFIFLNVKSAVLYWNDNVRRNYGMVVKVSNSVGDTIDSTIIFTNKACSENVNNSNDNNNSSVMSLPNEPSIIVITEQSRDEHERNDVRSKRDVPDLSSQQNSVIKYPRSRKRQCSSSEIDFTFKEMNLDWVLQPQGFTYRTCGGTCVSPKKSIRKRYRQLYKDPLTTDASENLCCGPTASIPLSIIHVDSQSQIHFSILHDFIVTECGCRV